MVGIQEDPNIFPVLNEVERIGNLASCVIKVEAGLMHKADISDVRDEIAGCPEADAELEVGAKCRMLV